MTRAPRLKTSVEVLRIRQPASVLAALFRHLAGLIVPGVSTADLERESVRFLKSRGAAAAQLGFDGFPAAICTSVNDVAAHGIPTENGPLEEGDLVTIDCVVEIAGWHADAAWTYSVGTIAAPARRLLRAAWRSSMAGIAACRAGRRTGEIARAVQHTAHSFGCSVLRDFSGHGIGRRIHEDPSISYAADAHEGEPIVPGMVLTIEPVLSLGNGSAPQLMSDGWTYTTRDGQPTAQYEHTVAVFADRTEVLTMEGQRWTIDYPPFT